MFKIFLDLINIQPTKDLILIKKLGKGSFGVVYLCLDLQNHQLMAQINAETSLLQIEFNLYQELNKLQNTHFPQIYKLIRDNNFMILQMQLLGCSLEDIIQKQPLPYQLLNFYLIQIIDSLQILHQLGFIHRDIKPENFILDSYNIKKIYLIDFGLIKKYYENQEHIEFKNGKKLCGTPRYASLNSHLGYELSRRDDLLSLGYMMIYCLKGRLPWQNTFAQNKEEKLNRIQTKKLQTSIKYLTQGLPIQYEQYFKYIKSLEFSADPDYNYIKNLFYEQKIINYDQYLEQFKIQYDFDQYLNQENFNIDDKNLSFQEQIDKIEANQQI